MIKHTTAVEKCSFAMAGTFGHECGAPATQVAVFAMPDKRDSACYPVAKYENETYFAGRCATCAKIKGGENAGAKRFEPLNGHANRWGY